MTPLPVRSSAAPARAADDRRAVRVADPRLRTAVVLVVAAATTAVASFVASGPTAVVGLGGAVVAVVLAFARTSGDAPWIAAVGLAVTCSAAATPTLGSDVGRGLAIAAPPIAVAATAVAIARPRRPLVVAAAMAAVVAGPIRALFDDPFLDAACDGCRHSGLAVLADRSIGMAVATTGLLALGASVLAMAPRSRRAPLLIAVVVLAAALLPAARLDQAGVAACALVVLLLSVAASAFALDAARRRLSELERGVAGGASATDLLRRATGEPALTIAFGSADDLLPTDGAPVREADRVVAVVRPASAALTALLSHPTPELLMALADERIDAELRTRVEDLRTSRARVVRTADEERRRLERDLHDGAQQHVLALGFDLRAALAVEEDPGRRSVIEACLAETMRALDDLRDISHGIYPPLLAIAGLAPSLRALGSRTPAPVVVGPLPGRLPPSVERVAYLLVSELAFASAGPVEVHAAATEGELRLSATCTAAEPSDLLRERIAALDGAVRRESTGSEEDRWLLTVPCA